jgi:hypothetical protein
MSPHQALALGVRLFAIWFALVTVREVIGFLGTQSGWDSPDELLFLIGGSVLTLGIVLVLWHFPRSIARGLLPISSEEAPQTSSYEMWFTLGTALIGLWFVASAIVPILRNLSVMYVLQPELTNAENLRLLRVGLFFYLGELLLGLCLLFGATGIRKLIWRIRYAGSD